MIPGFVRLNQDIIRVYLNISSYLILKDNVHESLEGCTSIAKTERHPFKAKGSLCRDEYYFFLILITIEDSKTLSFIILSTSKI